MRDIGPKRDRPVNGCTGREGLRRLRPPATDQRSRALLLEGRRTLCRDAQPAPCRQRPRESDRRHGSLYWQGCGARRRCPVHVVASGPAAETTTQRSTRLAWSRDRRKRRDRQVAHRRSLPRPRYRPRSASPRDLPGSTSSRPSRQVRGATNAARSISDRRRRSRRRRRDLPGSTRPVNRQRERSKRGRARR